MFVSLQRERRNRVEPRCVERWHLCDDEQFDLAAWFPSLKYRAGHVWPAFIFSRLKNDRIVKVRFESHLYLPILSLLLSVTCPDIIAVGVVICRGSSTTIVLSGC